MNFYGERAQEGGRQTVRKFRGAETINTLGENIKRSNTAADRAGLREVS